MDQRFVRELIKQKNNLKSEFIKMYLNFNSINNIQNILYNTNIDKQEDILAVLPLEGVTKTDIFAELGFRLHELIAILSELLLA